MEEIIRHIFKSSFTGPRQEQEQQQQQEQQEQQQQQTQVEDIPARMISENGRVGALFASKAFVQLVFNPFVGKATQKYGYELPFLIGTGFLLLSALSKFDFSRHFHMRISYV
jgi:hypothetical protein